MLGPYNNLNSKSGPKIKKYPFLNSNLKDKNNNKNKGEMIENSQRGEMKSESYPLDMGIKRSLSDFGWGGISIK